RKEILAVQFENYNIVLQNWEGNITSACGNDEKFFFLLWNQVLDRTCDTMSRSSISKSTKGMSQTIHTRK
ncbi:hypothetical protein VIGAN_02224200, partial [Vigna angularis var. angularis]